MIKGIHLIVSEVIMRSVKIRLYLVCVFLLSIPVLEASADEKPNILILHSYHPSFDWSKSIHEGMIQELDRWGQMINLSIEYMDTKRIATDEHIEGLITLYTAKYRQCPPDIVLSSDNNAFSFLYRHREEIFGYAVPVVFCAVNYFHPADWDGMDNILGVDESPDLEETIRIIDMIHPGKPSVAFINDRTPTGLSFRRGYEEWLENREDADRFFMVDNEYPDDLMEQIQALNGNWVLYYSTSNQDPAGNIYRPEAFLERLVRETDWPVYGNYLFMLDHGIIGGPIIDGHLQGVNAVRLAEGVLEGVIDPAQFQLVDSPSVPRFEYRQMKAANIRPNRLPEGSVIVNQPGAFWEEYPGETLLALVALVILLVGLLLVSRLLHQRSRLVSAFSDLNARLEERVELRSEELRRAETELLRSERLATLGSLVAGIAHEVNTPLGMTMTGASFLEDLMAKMRRDREQGRMSEEDLDRFLGDGWELCRSIVANTRRAADQIRNFKEVAVDQTGEDPRRFQMDTMLEEFLFSMKNELKRSRIQVEADCSPAIELYHFPGDLWRILANLLMNSLRHAFAPDEEGRIRIAAGEDGDFVDIRFSDNGRGIPLELKEQIFKPFFTTARQDGGSGLGLHLVRSIVEDRHHGTIEVSDNPGGGTIFHIRMARVSPALKDRGVNPEV